MDKSIIAVAIASFLATGLAIIMLRWAGRNPGIIGPEIDSPFFDVNVGVEPRHLVGDEWEAI